MLRLQTMVRLGGVLHFTILIASAVVPFALDWSKNLACLDPFLERLVWVYGFFIVLTIVGFGCISVIHASRLCTGNPLARAICAFIAVFWFMRLLVQLFVFDTAPFEENTPLLAGYHMLTAAFIYLTVVYSIASVFPREESR